jgi:hypothetical protein
LHKTERLTQKTIGNKTMNSRKFLISLLLLGLCCSAVFASTPRLAFLPTVDISLQGLGPKVDAWLEETLSSGPFTLLSPQVTATALTQLGIIDQMVRIPDNATSLGELLWADAIAYGTLAALGENYGLVVSIRNGVTGEMIAKERFFSATYTDFAGLKDFLAENVASVRPEQTVESPSLDLTNLVNSVGALGEGLGGLTISSKQVAILPPISISGNSRNLDQIYLQLTNNSKALNKKYQSLSQHQPGMVEVSATISSGGAVEGLSCEPSGFYTSEIESWLSSIYFGSSGGSCRVKFLLYFGE